METGEALGGIGNILLARVIDALKRQLEMRVDAALVNPNFEKALVDDIFNILRAMAKVQELNMAWSEGDKEAEDDYSMPEILNLIEERIETLAQERAADAHIKHAKPIASVSAQTDTKQRTANAAPSATSA